MSMDDGVDGNHFYRKNYLVIEIRFYVENTKHDVRAIWKPVKNTTCQSNHFEIIFLSAKNSFSKSIQISKTEAS